MKFIYALIAATVASAAPLTTLSIGLPPSIPSNIKSAAFIDESIPTTRISTISISLKSSSSSSSESLSDFVPETSSSTVPSAEVPKPTRPVYSSNKPAIVAILPYHRPGPATTDDYIQAFRANSAAHERHYADFVNEAAVGGHHKGPRHRHQEEKSHQHHHHHHHHYYHHSQGHDGLRRFRECAHGWGEMEVDGMVMQWMGLPWAVRMFVWVSTCFGVSMIVVGAVVMVINLLRAAASVHLADDLDEEAQYPIEKAALSISTTGIVPESALMKQ